MSDRDDNHSVAEPVPQQPRPSRLTFVVKLTDEARSSSEESAVMELLCDDFNTYLRSLCLLGNTGRITTPLLIKLFQRWELTLSERQSSVNGKQNGVSEYAPRPRPEDHQRLAELEREIMPEGEHEPVDRIPRFLTENRARDEADAIPAPPPQRRAR